MESAAFTLIPPLSLKGPPLSVHLLTGGRFWYQSAFCLWTLSLQSRRSIAPVIYDDGTLETPMREALTRLFPKVTFVSKPEALARLDTLLPVERFPVLRERWINYPHIRKIIDPHVGSTEWKLVIDSDLLFFRSPDFLLRWLENPSRPLHAVDCETSYGYPVELMGRLAGQPIASLVNVGMAGLNGADIDWARLESWAKTLIENFGPNYYLEQALVAMLVAGRSCDIAPAPDYVTLPRLPEARDGAAVMHHYVAGSKRWYFEENWRNVMMKLEGRPTSRP
jgi:hypothetical protein